MQLFKNTSEGKRIMRYLAWVLGGVLILQTPVPVSAAQSSSTYEEYRAGTMSVKEAEGYTVVSVSTEEELARLAEDCRLDSWSRDKLVQLEQDIELDRYTELMIPDFGGIFEGNGHKISNLHIESAGSAAGLFRYLQEGASVRNLHVQGRVEPDGTRSRAGGIVGVNYGLINGCTFTGLVSGDSEVGGIAGSNMESGEIRNCTSGAAVLGNHSTGGIAGSNRGVLSRCKNTGNINTFSEEVFYELEDITVERLEDLGSTSNVTAHTDTGGIAGISYGKLYACTNTGTVGYVHVGYNVGGIAGRLSQGYLSDCRNEGHVLGRKDVGGIAGQMEPFLVVEYMTDKLQELDEEMETLFDLLDHSAESLGSYGSQAADIMKSSTDHLDKAHDAGGRLVDTAGEVWYIYNQELRGIGRDMRRLNDEIRPDDGKDGTGDGADKEIGSIGHNIESYLAALGKFGDSTGKHLQKMADAADAGSEDFSRDLSTFEEELSRTGDDLDRLAEVLDQGADSADANADAICSQARVIQSLVSGIRDDLFAYEGLVVEDASDESAGEASEVLPSDEESKEELYAEENYDTASFRKGKIEGCRNEGRVEADSTVGGIVGQIAIEYDMDPEDDLTYTGEESLQIERKVKAVVRDSLNRGEIVGKRNYVGGIAGKADFGVIISCESYGDVSSTGGSKVGGVAGASGYAIRSCYSMGKLSGQNQVGGIVGKGCDVFYSYAYNQLEAEGECCGSIAGTLEDTGTLYGNYYVENNRGGVDGIGYQGGATPLSYGEFCASRGIPQAFTGFHLSLRAGGVELAVLECGYGESVEKDMIPDIPVRDGCYGVWPEFDFDCVTDNAVLEAQYERWLGSLAGEERDETGKSLILVEGQFLPGSRLETVERENGTEIVIMQPGFEKGRILSEYEDYRRPVTVRILCEDADNIRVEVERDGAFTEADTETIGGYVIFAMEEPGVFRVTKQENRAMLTVILAAAAALVSAAVLIRTGRSVKRRRAETAAKSMAGEVESGGGDTGGSV